MLNIVVTYLSDEDHTVIYESHCDTFKVYIRVFTDEEISKRLNTLRDNIKNKKELTEIEVLDFAYILLFAQENKAKKYSEDVANLFYELKGLDKNLQYDIYYVLKKLIRLHFRDDKTKTKELLTMITKAVHPDVFKDMPTLQRMYKKMENINEEISLKDDIISEKDNEISKKDKEIMKLRKKLKENNIEVD